MAIRKNRVIGQVLDMNDSSLVRIRKTSEKYFKKWDREQDKKFKKLIKFYEGRRNK